MGRGESEKTLSKNRASSSKSRSIPLPLPLATTVPEGQPIFRLISPYPKSRITSAAQRKSPGSLVSTWGTAVKASLSAFGSSRISLDVSAR